MVRRAGRVIAVIEAKRCYIDPGNVKDAFLEGVSACVSTYSPYFVNAIGNSGGSGTLP